MRALVICNECNWTGKKQELFDKITLNGGDECVCPNCGSFEGIDDKPECCICGEQELELKTVLDRLYCYWCHRTYGENEIYE